MKIKNNNKKKQLNFVLVWLSNDFPQCVSLIKSQSRLLSPTCAEPRSCFDVPVSKPAHSALALEALMKRSPRTSPAPRRRRWWGRWWVGGGGTRPLISSDRSVGLARAGRRGEDVTHHAGHRLVSLKCTLSSGSAVIAPQITMAAGGCGGDGGL